PVAGQPVSFANSSTDPDAGDSLRHQWDFHDGSTSALASPTHVFAQPGEYLVTLVADDSHLNGTDDVQKLITVAPAPAEPIADFTFDPAEPLPGQTIAFTNLSANALSSNWNFGDLTSSTLKNPTKSYAVAATYTVTLTVSNFNGTASISKDVTVGGNQPPVLSDVSIPSTAQAGQPVSFSAGASDLNHDPVTATWTFGDGWTATGWALTHTYAAPGEYIVTVTASDGHAQDVASGTITITVPPPPPPTKLSAYSIHASNIGNPHGIPIQYGGLDARQSRQWVHWTGCAPDWYPNGDPDIGYDLPVIRTFAATNPGRLYIFVDEPGHGTPGNHKNGAAPGCTQVTPQQYARAFQKFVAEVRAVDPTARFAPGGFEQFPANASAYGAAFVDYATEFYNAYLSKYGVAPPVAEWRFHVYWENHWTLMTDWQAKASAAIAFAEQHGAPVVLGIGFPWHATYDPRMLDAMSWIADYVRRAPAVSSVFWWSYDFHEDGHNRLTTYSGGSDTARTLTNLGEAYQSLINGGAAVPVAPPAGSLVFVTPDASPETILSASSGSRSFTVTNAGNAAATYLLRASCAGSIVNCGAASLSELSLAPGQSATVSVSYTAGASGAGELRLAAAHAIATNVTDVGSFSMTVTAPAFAIDLSPHNAENLDVSQFAATLGYTTPAYYVFDAERSVTLFYSSAQAIPAGLVQVDVADTSAAPPEQYSILLRTPDGTPVQLTNGAYENFYRGGSGVTRLAAQFGKVGGEWLPTGAHH
ncbi:MAG TPA: PKD domain-containing protein, partial [Thermoanaerobaculia bacterium]|nr:PKD domain-containing protein [Thermoanaerobaculia bacterium]